MAGTGWLWPFLLRSQDEPPGQPPKLLLRHGKPQSPHVALLDTDETGSIPFPERALPTGRSDSHHLPLGRATQGLSWGWEAR